MASRVSDAPRLTPVKIVVAGGFGVGKTTFVSAISEIEPLRSEAVMTQESAGIDELFEGNTKTTTTVAMDFGRISLKGSLVLYLFGTPGQDRFRFMWHELSKGAIGAVVLVDTRRLEACFPAVDFFEKQGVPFLVAVNTFNGEKLHSLTEVANALAISPSVPIVHCDACHRLAVQEALVRLVDHALTRALEGAAAP